MDDQSHEDRLPAIIEYLQADLARRDHEKGVIHFHYHEAERSLPPPPKPDVLARYTPYMILYLGFAIIAGVFAVIFVMIAQALMIVMISLAVCALAVAAAIRSLRLSKIEAKYYGRDLDS